MKHGRHLISLAIEGKSLPGCVIDDPHKPTARLASVDIRQSMYTMMSPLMKENRRVIEIMRNDLSKDGNIEYINKMVDHEVMLSTSHTLPSVLDSLMMRSSLCFVVCLVSIAMSWMSLIKNGGSLSLQLLATG